MARDCWIVWSPHGSEQAIRVKRQRHQVKTGKTSSEEICAFTSLRYHYQIENCQHYVCDFTYDEDLCCV